ncbi:MAG: hypothetical protein INR71_09250 [Terriglobus roseus]|nr:hypothetical protein [Terriglobus roseus]
MPACSVSSSRFAAKLHLQLTTTPLHTYRLLPMNFRFVKLNHHLLGVV